MSSIPGPTVIGYLLPTHIPAEIDDMPPFEPRVFTVGSEERVACLPPQGLPEPSMWWEHAGVRLPAHGRVYQKGHELVFASTAESDAGVYTCHAANLAGQRQQDVNITVASKHPDPEGGGEPRSWAVGVIVGGFLGAHSGAFLALLAAGWKSFSCCGARHGGWVTAHRKMVLWLQRTAMERSPETQVPLCPQSLEGP